MSLSVQSALRGRQSGLHANMRPQAAGFLTADLRVSPAQPPTEQALRNLQAPWAGIGSQWPAAPLGCYTVGPSSSSELS